MSSRGRTVAADARSQPAEGPQSPSVSVIVPTYQRREHVRRAVASVLAQTHRDLELIVIDDGSDDGTEAALSPLNDRLVYHWQSNRGVAAARNAGVRLARAPIVAFLDSDNRWLPSHLAVVTGALDRHPQAVLASTCPGFEFAGRWRRSEPRLLNPFPLCLLGNIAGFVSCIAVRRVALLDAGGFDETFPVAEDIELWQRLALLGEFSTVRRRTVIREYCATSLVERGRVRGQYIDALRRSGQRLIAEVEQDTRPDAAALVRQTEGALAFNAALVAIASGQDTAARMHLHRACSKLPELSRAPRPVIGYTLAMLPKSHLRKERLRYLRALAELWPDRRADSPVFVTGLAFWTAARAGRPLETVRLARRWLAAASPGYIGRTMGARRGRARRRLDRRLHSARQ